MAITDFIKKICTKLGENSKSTYGVVAVAVANAIFRPTFTMLKKGENPDSKRYAALREGITEAIAIPTYIACGEMAAICGKYISEKHMDKVFAEEVKKGIENTEAVKKARKDVAVKKGRAGLMLIGVCTAAGLVIPGLCSVIVTPIMTKINKENAENVKKLNIKEPEISVPAAPVIHKPDQLISRPAFKTFTASLMKVGGV